MTVRSVRGCIAWLAATAAVLAALPASAQLPKAPAPTTGKGGAPAKPAPPVALLVALEDYDKPLKYPVASAARLAARLREYGYAVTVLTDETSAAHAKEELKNAKAGGVEVESVASEGEKVDERVRQWFGTKLGEYTSPSPLGILVLSGHGEMRDGKQYLLTKADAPGKGGVDVRSIQQAAAKKRLPLVMLVDTCRTAPAPGGATPAAKGWGVGLDLVSRGSLEKGGPAPVTTVYARQPGRVAPDQELDLVRAFADALEYDQAGKLFVAQRHLFDEPASLAARPNPDELTLKCWIHAATTRYQWGHDCEPHGLERGLPDLLTTVVAVRPQAKGKAAPGRRAEVVLGDWQVANCVFDQEAVADGVRLTRPAKGADRYGYCIWRPAAPLPTEGKTLVLEVYADGVKGFQVHAKNQAGKATVYFTADPATKFYQLTDRTVTTLLLPLTQGDGKVKMDELGLATSEPGYDKEWPAGASLTVTAVRVVDTAALPKAMQNRHASYPSVPANLLGRWWHNDAPPEMLPQLTEQGGVAGGDKRPYLELGTADGGREGWRGGRIEPPVFLPGGAEVAVEVSVAAAAKPGQTADVVLYSGEKVVARVNARLADIKGVKTFTAKVEGSASVDYMTVTTDGAKVRLSRVGVPPPPKK